MAFPAPPFPPKPARDCLVAYTPPPRGRRRAAAAEYRTTRAENGGRSAQHCTAIWAKPQGGRHRPKIGIRNDCFG